MFKSHPFISEASSEKFKTAGVAWATAGEVQPPNIILPITVEPSKPRLYTDALFLNRWIKGTPFSPVKLVDVPWSVYIRI